MTPQTMELPLSPLQEAMWISWQREPEHWAHLVPMTLAVHGELDVDRLRDALHAVCARHPVLRGRVVTTPSGTKLTWADAPAIPFTVAEAGEQGVAEARLRPLDLERGPLARMDVLHGSTGTTVVFTVHHLVLDGTATPVLLDELSRAYRGERLDAPDDPQPFIDYARRSWRLVTGTEGEPSRRFWREMLAGVTPADPLPIRRADGPHSPVVSPLTPQLVADVRRTARELETTHFTIIYGALFIALHQHTGAHDLIVSTAYHGRRERTLSRRVGSFSTILPIRQRLSGADTYRDMVRGLGKDLRTAIEHGDLPLPAILRAADLAGPDARTRTHEVVLTYWNATRGPADVRHLDFSTAELDLVDVTNASDHRLTVMLQEDSIGSRLLWQDPGRTLDPALVSALARDHLALVADMVTDPDRRLVDGLVRLQSRPAAPRRAVVAAPAVPAVPTAPPVSTADHEIVDALEQVWCELLDVPSVAEQDSFFALGGHSLMATTMVNRITERLGVALSVRDLFAHPVLGDLAHLVARLPRVTDTAAPQQDRPDAVLRASRFQEAIWLAGRMDPTHARYHIPLTWEVAGRLDVETLRAALALLINRHEILRTRFVDRDGLLHQEVGSPWPPEVEETDLTAVSEVGRRARLAAWSERTAGLLDPGKGRLLRVGLFTVGEDSQILMLCAHHLVLDGESVPMLLSELELCHRIATHGGELPPPPDQYRDLVTGDGRAEDLAYWRRRLDGAPSSLGWRTPAEPEPHGGVAIPLAADTSAALLPVRLRHKASGFMIAATAVAAVLHRWTGLPDLTFGIPVADRGRHGAGEVLGPCLNTLVSRSRCDNTATLADLLATIREEVISAFEHQDAPFDSVVRELRPPRSPGHTPYVDVAVNNVSLARWSATLGEARLTPVNFVSEAAEVSKFPMTITFTEAPGTIAGTVSYRGDRVSRADALGVARDIASLLNGFAEHLATPVFHANSDVVRS